MKLRIKIHGTAFVFTVAIENGQVSLEQLRQLIVVEIEKSCPKLSGLSFGLSLNGKTPLEVTDGAATVGDTGIVAGDTIRLLFDADISELLGEEYVCKKSTQPSKVPDSQRTVNVSDGSAHNDNEESVEMDTSNDTSDTGNCSEDSFINRYMSGPMLCREATNARLPCNLMREYKSSSVVTKMDAIVVVIKVLMSEEGFTLKETSGSILDKKSLTLQYTHSSSCDTVCKLICVPVGEMLLVNGLIADQVLVYNIHPKMFIKADPQTQPDPVLVYQKLPTLSRSFKDQIVFPVIHAINAECGIGSIVCLETFPVEILIHVLRMLDFRSLIYLSQSCKRFHITANDNLLWRDLFFRDFKMKASDAQWQILNDLTTKGIWKAAYNEAYKEKIRQAKSHKSTLPMLWSFDEYVHRLLPLTGGDYDRFPTSRAAGSLFNVRPYGFIAVSPRSQVNNLHIL